MNTTVIRSEIELKRFCSDLHCRECGAELVRTENGACRFHGCGRIQWFGRLQDFGRAVKQVKKTREWLTLPEAFFVRDKGIRGHWEIAGKEGHWRVFEDAPRQALPTDAVLCRRRPCPSSLYPTDYFVPAAEPTHA